jgi:hypothetical protein
LWVRHAQTLRQRADARHARRLRGRGRHWHDGNRPGYALGRWLREYREQAWLLTRDFAVPRTNHVSERGAKAAKRHQAVSESTPGHILVAGLACTALVTAVA